MIPSVEFDRFDEAKSWSSDSLAWRFLKFPRGMLEFQIYLHFDYRRQKWSVRPDQGYPSKYPEEKLIAMLPDSERAKALAAAIDGSFQI